MKSVRYDLQGNVATICIDDGKRNALSPEVLDEIHTAFDRAEAAGASVIVTGRDGVFSAGFDLNVMRRGGMRALGMLRSGYRLPARVLAYPHPVIAACNGHCLAMGMFLMLSADYIVGSRGDFRIAANEVALGLRMPRVAAAVLRHRLTPAAYQRAVTLAAEFDTEAALDAGVFDELVEPPALLSRATALATGFENLDPRAHRSSKRRIRAATLRRIRLSLWPDLLDAALLGLIQMRSRSI